MPASTSSDRPPRTVALIQARMGSRRLPGKMLADVGGRPLLARLVERIRPAQTLDAIVVATTRLPEDDAIADLAGRLGAGCSRGAVGDVLDRLYEAARE